MIEICNKKEAHVQRAYAELIGNNEITIQFSPNLFNEARRLFEQLGNGYISVVNEKNERLFDLINKQDFYWYDNGVNHNSPINCNYDGCDLVREKQYLDTDIIEMYDTFVFYRLEEYTYAIARLITECYPDKNVIFMDSAASLFNENWCIIDDEELLLKRAGGQF